MQIEQPSEDLLAIEEIHVRATAGKRLANYVIDLLLFYFLIIGFGILLAILSPSAAELFAGDNPGFGILDRIITLLMYALYMGTIEAIFKGKSLGKFITKTRALNVDGGRLSTSDAFLRGFSRAVPFCVFSAFGSPCNPWQDRWTDTMVVDDKSRHPDF
ncbi:MAG: RDD family protein [Ferruginibacter sp.]